MSIRVINADVLVGLSQLADESVHCVVTSPPYWGLRDYGAEGQIGLEPTLAEHIAKLVQVFREVRRVLRSDGTLWLNYGDAYAQGHGGSSTEGKGVTIRKTSRVAAVAREREDVDIDGWGKRDATPRNVVPGFKPKDLLMMPERLAIALQDDGWWVRSRIIWHKPNPMPESVTDRPTKSHEHIWLMSKAPRYFYDAEAIKEDATSFGRPHTSGEQPPKVQAMKALGIIKEGGSLSVNYERENRNARDVWTIATAPFAEAHFATFPPELAERCIKAGTSEKGCCAKCGAPWERQVERETRPNWQGGDKQKHDGTHYRPNPGGGVGNDRRAAIDMGWGRSCSCDAPAVPCTVLDPFGGSGTTGLVADRLQRNAILIELNPTYAAMAARRMTNDAPLFAEVSV